MQNEETIREIFFEYDDNDDQLYSNQNNNIDNYNVSHCKLQRKNEKRRINLNWRISLKI